ncbi:hypothetical protein BHE74_00051972, partial [Ensete ventricosum]
VVFLEPAESRGEDPWRLLLWCWTSVQVRADARFAPVGTFGTSPWGACLGLRSRYVA